jgi:hypothetical protein
VEHNILPFFKNYFNSQLILLVAEIYFKRFKLTAFINCSSRAILRATAT